MDQRLRKHEHDQKQVAEQKRAEQTAYKQQLDQIKTTLDQQRHEERAGKLTEQTELQEKNKVLEQYNVLKKQEDEELKSYL